MPTVHMGMGKVAAVSFIMICWRTRVKPVQPIMPKKNTEEPT